jgi:hypothetical protein
MLGFGLNFGGGFSSALFEPTVDFAFQEHQLFTLFVTGN